MQRNGTHSSSLSRKPARRAAVMLKLPAGNFATQRQMKCSCPLSPRQMPKAVSNCRIRYAKTDGPKIPRQFSHLQLKIWRKKIQLHAMWRDGYRCESRLWQLRGVAMRSAVACLKLSIWFQSHSVSLSLFLFHTVGWKFTLCDLNYATLSATRCNLCVRSSVTCPLPRGNTCAPAGFDAVATTSAEIVTTSVSGCRRCTWWIVQFQIKSQYPQHIETYVCPIESSNMLTTHHLHHLHHHRGSTAVELDKITNLNTVSILIKESLIY